MTYRTSLPLHPTEDDRPKPLITKRRKKHARESRPTTTYYKGERASHRMESGDIGDEGKYKYAATPSLFPNKDGTWSEKTGSEGWKEANKRGEVYAFKRERAARKFAHGSWKKGADRRSAMKVFREENKEERQKKRRKNIRAREIKRGLRKHGPSMF